MAKDEFSLLPGEKVELKTNPHWWFFWKHIVAAVVVLLLLILWLSWSTADHGFAHGLRVTTGWIVVVVFIGIIGATVLRFIEWRTTTFIVTDKRIAYQSGLVRRTGMSIQLNRINNVSYDQGLLERALNNGTLTIESAAEQGQTVFRNIPHPNKTRQLIYREIEGDEDRASARDGEAIASAIAAQAAPDAASAAAQPTAAERLKQLQDLHAQGIVTDAEFEAKKAELLREL